MSQASLALPARQWRLIAFTLIGIVAVLGAAYYWFFSSDYAVLAKGIRPEQAAAMVDELKKQDVSYELRDGGTTILVPTNQVDGARLDLASGDIPVKGTVGFELFNQSDMGLTDFAQKVNYQRALQGEIARTIMTMDGIAYARVHLALPERSLFRASRSEPRAAVTLTPQPGVDIDAARIAGIQRLVAATVPDLAIDQVAVLNERGQLLTPEFSDVPAAAGSDSALEFNYADRVTRAIAEAAPRAHVQVKVTVVPRPDSPLAEPGAASAGGSDRDHSLRVILFERTPLGATDQAAIRQAVAAELTLNFAAGDQLSFSPAPEVSALSTLAPAAGPFQIQPATREAAQAEFMARLTRSWMLAFAVLAALVAGVAMFRIRRDRTQRRAALAERIRRQFLLPEGAANAA
ncbi:MAG TPA: flagellar basal-body MS-ring/collar protein FliF [Sphingomicrobium sp.]|nr:flagellar basal-body MS-ring/collar protein FliF [Sphingomicrobium sp.]